MRRRLPVVLAVLLPAVLAAPAGAQEPVPLFRISAHGSGAPLVLGSTNGDLSQTGRYAVWETEGSPVPGDVNRSSDVYRSDRVTGQVVRVSAPLPGTRATGGGSILPTISDDGRYVAFMSDARHLVPGDTDDRTGVFLRDVDRGRTEQVDVTPTGRPGGAASFTPELSGDGRHVVFCTTARDLLPGGGPQRRALVLRDLGTGRTSQVDVATSGTPADRPPPCTASVSDDGTRVAFSSPATDLVPGGGDPAGLYVRDLLAGTTTRVATGLQPALSGDGRTLAFTELVTCQLVLVDLVTSARTTASRSLSGGPADSCSTTFPAGPVRRRPRRGVHVRRVGPRPAGRQRRRRRLRPAG